MSTDDSGNSIRRILVAIDASEHSQAALHAAVDLARRVHGEVLGIFVEDENLLRMGDISFTREIRLLSTRVAACSTKDIRRQLRVQAQRAEELVTSAADRAGVPSSFRVVRGQVTSQLLAAAREIDMIALGRVGHSGSAQRAVGSTTKAVLRRASLPVMVLEEGVRLKPPVLVLSDGSPSAEKALALAGEITRTAEYMPLSIVVVGETANDAERLRENARQAVKPYNVPVSLESVNKPSPHQLLHLIESQNCGIVLSPVSLLEEYPEELHQVIAAVNCPIVFMR